MNFQLRRIRPHRLHHLIGVSPAAFANACEAVWRVRPDRRTGRPHALPFTERVFLVMLHLRTNLTERQLAEFFGIADSTAHETIATYEATLAALLGAPRVDRRHLYVVDGTLIPPHDRSRTAPSKNYRRSVNVQVVVQRKTRLIAGVAEARAGNRNDIVAWRESHLPEAFKGARVIGDGGYRGAATFSSPKRQRDGRIIRDDEYVKFSRKRATAEHVLAELKHWQMMRQIRRRGEAIDVTVRAAALLHNLNRNPDWLAAA